jgi:hypothetical protein
LTEKNLILPFFDGGSEAIEFTFPAELACVVSMAVSQRRKTGLLRETAEKISAISKIRYPIWVISFEAHCIALDGLAAMSHEFTLNEPVNIDLFVEELKKNSVNSHDFIRVLEKQGRNIRELASPVSVSFKALIANRELLNFLAEYFVRGTIPSEENGEKAVEIPLQIDENEAMEIHEELAKFFRRVNAGINGFHYALEVLNEEAEFQKRMILNEIERLKENEQLEVSRLKPEVEERVKKLALKRDSDITNILKDTEKKGDTLTRKLEKCVRRLKTLEQRKESVQSKARAPKRRKSATKRTYKTYEFERLDKEIGDVRKEIRALSNLIENTKKDGSKQAKEVEDAARKAVALEEERIKELNSVYESRIDKRNEQIGEIVSEVAAMTKGVESLVEDVRSEASGLRNQIGIDFKTCDRVIACVPFYIIEYAKGSEERYSVLSPMSISGNLGVVNGLRRIFTFTSDPRLKLLIRPMSVGLDETLGRNLSGKIQSEESFRESINKILTANNLLKRDGFKKTLDEGLEEIQNRGWINPEEVPGVRKGIEDEAE